MILPALSESSTTIKVSKRRANSLKPCLTREIDEPPQQHNGQTLKLRPHLLVGDILLLENIGELLELKGIPRQRMESMQHM